MQNECAQKVFPKVMHSGFLKLAEQPKKRHFISERYLSLQQRAQISKSSV